MNTYTKYAPNVFVAKCDARHEKGETITMTTKYGQEHDCTVFNLVSERDGFFYYSIVRNDGFNFQEHARRKAERLQGFAATASKKSDEYYGKSRKDGAFLSLGEPVKVGHHSERRHRKAIEQAWTNTGKSVEMSKKADAYESRAEYWERRATQINLSMPESVEYYEYELEKAIAYHEDVKSGKIQRDHSYTLTYAKKARNEAEKRFELAKKLWGE